MKIIQHSNINKLMNMTVETINNLIIQTKKNSINLGLVGGSTIPPLYKKLAKYNLPEYSKIEFFVIDERKITLTNKQSNYSIISKTLFNPLLRKKIIRNKNIHKIETDLSPKEEITRCSNQLKRYGNKIDIAVVSAGEDGHVAAIFPNLSYSTESYIYFENSPKPPSKRFTISPLLLSQTTTVFVLYIGESKENALRHILNKNSKKTLPEKTLLSVKNLFIITDRKLYF